MDANVVIIMLRLACLSAGLVLAGPGAVGTDRGQQQLQLCRTTIRPLYEPTHFCCIAQTSSVLPHCCNVTTGARWCFDAAPGANESVQPPGAWLPTDPTAGAHAGLLNCAYRAVVARVFVATAQNQFGEGYSGYSLTPTMQTDGTVTEWYAHVYSALAPHTNIEDTKISVRLASNDSNAAGAEPALL
mgnify:CR=1 FL=1